MSSHFQDFRLIRPILILTAGFLANVAGNTPPACATTPLAATKDTIFTQQYYGNQTALQYYMLRGCSGTRVIDSVNAQLIRPYGDFQAELRLTGGTPATFTVMISYTGYNQKFQYTYSSIPYVANPKLSIALDSNIRVNNPALDGCILCPLAKTSAGAAIRDTVILRVNFYSGNQAYPVIMRSIIRQVPNAIHGFSSIHKPGERKGLFLPELIGREMRINSQVRVPTLSP